MKENVNELLLGVFTRERLLLLCVLTDYAVKILWSTLTGRSRSVAMRRPTCGVRPETAATLRGKMIGSFTV